jgi:hypothetical protein
MEMDRLAGLQLTLSIYDPPKLMPPHPFPQRRCYLMMVAIMGIAVSGVKRYCFNPDTLSSLLDGIAAEQ